MTRTTRAFPPVKIALALACLACALMVWSASALAAEGATEPTVHYQQESYAEYEKQLVSGQIAAVTINKFVRSARVTLKDGRHVLAKYPKHEEPAVAAKLKAKGVPVTVLAPTVARTEAKKPVHHKLRYIAGGIVIVVILIVGGVLLVSRRRRLAME